jgi:hypothetical protein
VPAEPGLFRLRDDLEHRLGGQSSVVVMIAIERNALRGNAGIPRNDWYACINERG